MNTFIRMLMLLLVLGSLGTPASARVSDESMSASTATVMHHEAATAAAAENQHECCDDDADVNNTIAIQHLECDNSCSDCQHHCAGSASALTQAAFTFPSTLPTQPLRIEGSVTAALPGYLDRPPMA